MRTRQWLKSLLSGCLAVAGGLSAYAQAPPFQQYGPGNPDATGMLPPPYNANYGPGPQAYPGMESAGYPPGANAWPNVSPYMGPPVDQTTYENGNWFNRQFTGNRKYYFSTEALVGNAQRGANTRIGAYGVNEIPQVPGLSYIDHNQLFFESIAFIAGNNMPDRFVTATGGGGGGGQGTGDVPIFVQRNNHDLHDPSQAGGIRSTWGWFNPDQSGFQVSGFWLNNTNSNYFSGSGIPFDEADSNFGYTNYDQLRLRAFSGVPLAGADSDGDGRPGFVMPLDIYYKLQFESQLGGANADWYWAAIYDRPGMLVRPVGGGRLLSLRERFTFDGADSGLGYSIQGAQLNQQGGNNTTAGSQVYAPILIDPEFSTANVMNSYLTSGAQSILAGPEAGLRLDFGNDGFKIWTQSKFGLLANTTRRTLQGYNIGDAYYVANGRTTPIMPRDNQALTSFSSSHTSTWLSPMFEQSFNVKTHLFQFVPGLNKSRILSNAEFQAGYTLLVLGQMSRPAQQIDWQAYPINPQLKTERSTYTNNIYNFGIEWTY